MAKATLDVDDARKEVKINGKYVPLTPKEYMLLVTLRDAKKVLTRPYLLEQLWDIKKSMNIDTRTVDQHIARLRRKVEKAGYRAPIIHTRTSFGYIWAAE